MELGRFLVEAVVVGGSSPSELARSHPISRSWLFRLLARYKAGGYAALEPRSRRPKSSPRQVGADVSQALIAFLHGPRSGEFSSATDSSPRSPTSDPSPR